jgi:diadenosine tetraphosphate (Ap4A) HIT family hydrolase
VVALSLSAGAATTVNAAVTRTSGSDRYATAGEIFKTAGEIASELGLDSYRTNVNTGAGAGQSVFHAHLHLLGGRSFAWPPG